MCIVDEFCILHLKTSVLLYIEFVKYIFLETTFRVKSLLMLPFIYQKNKNYILIFFYFLFHFEKTALF